MSARREDLRKAMGHALRRVRQGWQLSLDDVEQASIESGVRITRSHLSRVENGQADLALPRFLSLMRAVGEPAAAVVEVLDGLLEPDEEPAQELEWRAERALTAGDAATAAGLLRRASRRASAPLPAASLETWARAEAALGRWQAASRALHLALARDARAEAGCLVRLAVVALGCGQPGIALPLVRGVEADGPAALLVRCSAQLEAGLPVNEQDVSRATGAGGTASAPGAAVGLLVRGEVHRRNGQPRAARDCAERALASGEGVVVAEAGLALSRVLGDMRRPAAGLHALDRVRSVARSTGVPDLLARAHTEAERLHRLAGDRSAARDAARAARALARRHGSDPGAPRALPLHALFRL